MLSWRPVVWPWPCDPKSKKDNFLSKVKHRVIKYWVHNTLDEDQRIDLDLWSPDQKNLLSMGNLWSKFSHYQSKKF